MAEKPVIDRTKVTFSQAEGLSPLPTPLALGELSKEARSLLWLMVHEGLEADSDYPTMGGYRYIKGRWKDVLFAIHVAVKFEPADEFSTRFPRHVETLKSLIYKGDLHEVFDFITFVMRSRVAPPKFTAHMKWALKQSRAAYSIIDDGPTIIPTATPEEGQAINDAFALTEQGGFNGARSHLRNAADALNNGDFAGSVRESIHAVESIACSLNADASVTLGPALTALEKHITIHPALKRGFSSIYGYTSDQDGIRHALLEGEAEVDAVDATFMFGACASFVTYLINKGRLSGIATE